MDDLMTARLKRIAVTLEISKGQLKLFACIWRSEIKKWDVIVSADWVNYGELKENIGYVFDAFKAEFNGEFALLFSGIYPLSTTEALVKGLTQTFSVDSANDEIRELREVSIGDIRVDKILIVVSR